MVNVQAFYDGSINVAYGRPEDLRFVYENGQLRGHFTHQKNKQFRMSDDEWSGDKSTLAHGEARDFMRPWYFLSVEESQNMMSGYGTSDFAWKVIDQDTSNFTPFMKDMADLQASLDFMENQEIKTDDPTTFLESSTKGLRRIINKQFTMSEKVLLNETFANSSGFPKESEAYGLNTKWDSYRGPFNPGIGAFHELNAQVITRKMRVLDTTRRLAAQSAGVDYRVYNDFVKDLPVAGSIDALKNQYLAIAGYRDRNQYQIQYLQEKAWLRYLMGVTNHFGYGADLQDTLVAATKAGTIIDGHVFDLFPEKYYTEVGDAKQSALTATPAWVNKGETPLGFIDMADWQKEAEKEFIQSDSRLRHSIIEEIGYDPEDLIQQNGLRTKTINVANELQRQHEVAKNVEDDLVKAAGQGFDLGKDWGDAGQVDSDFGTVEERMNTGAYKEMLRGIKERTKVGEKRHSKGFKDKIKYSQIKGYKAEWAARLIQQKKEFDVQDRARVYREKSDYTVAGLTQRKHKDVMSGFSQLARRYRDTNQKITYSNFLQRLQDPAFDPNLVGVKSFPDLYMGLLQKSAHWVPDKLTLNEHNLPAFLVDGVENHYKPLLEINDEMPDIKANADRLHDLVNIPATQRYIERYHPNWSSLKGKSNAEIAKDFAGVELFDDWALPFKHNQNSVMVNHQIHTRMDFGFDEV